MKTVGAALDAHLALPTTTIATCWKITRRDGTVYSFTDHDAPLVVSAVTYLASTAYKRTAIEDTAGLQTGNLDVVGAFSSTSIVEADLRAGKWDYAAVEVFEVNWADLTQGVIRQRKGRLGEVKAGRSEFTVQLRGLMENLQQNIGILYAAQCNADLGDARCGISLVSYTVTGAVTGVANNRQFTDTARVEATDYFTSGKVTWTAGLNTGLSMEIKSFSGGVFLLFLPMPYTVNVADNYSIVAGCTKRLNEDCIAKFGNAINFRGFPFLPGLDKMVTGGR